MAGTRQTWKVGTGSLTFPLPHHSTIQTVKNFQYNMHCVICMQTLAPNLERKVKLTYVIIPCPA